MVSWKEECDVEKFVPLFTTVASDYTFSVVAYEEDEVLFAPVMAGFAIKD
jgi:hypothetical protein